MTHTCLYEHHVLAGAKLVEFAGYMMPVRFSAIKDEHLAVRENAGVFDISHMGLFQISGSNAYEFLQNLSCNDLRKAVDGVMVYSMFLNESGCVLDDVMVGGVGPDEFILVVNASNKSKISSWMNAHLMEQVRIEDLNDDHSFLAVQGPKAVEVLASTFGLPLSERSRFAVWFQEFEGKISILMRTGYTGEDGFEWIVPNTLVEKIWGQLITASVTPCGLGARDTLRLEAGLPLYGQELSETITPLMTRYQWVVKLQKEFIGKAALEAAKQSPPVWTTVGFKMNDRVIPRTHYEIVEGGEVTSGTLSPSLDVPIGMALVKPEYAKPGSTIHIQIRGKQNPATVVALPFVD